MTVGAWAMYPQGKRLLAKEGERRKDTPFYLTRAVMVGIPHPTATCLAQNIPVTKCTRP